MGEDAGGAGRGGEKREEEEERSTVEEHARDVRSANKERNDNIMIKICGEFLSLKMER